jgi:phosphoribosyl-ATP pyrophosphohydrolase
MSSTDVLDALGEMLDSRRGQSPDESYVARLHSVGLDKILEKVGEEAIETVIAAKNGDADAVIHETADLWFHTMVMLSHLNITPGQVVEELGRRVGTSGLAEKAARSQ